VNPKNTSASLFYHCSLLVLVPSLLIKIILQDLQGILEIVSYLLESSSIIVALMEHLSM